MTKKLENKVWEKAEYDFKSGEILNQNKEKILTSDVMWLLIDLHHRLKLLENKK